CDARLHEHEPGRQVGGRVAASAGQGPRAAARAGALGGLAMLDDMVMTGQAAQAGNGSGQRGRAGWNVPGYTALKALGSGGFGDVVLARHDQSGTLVAIKYLRPGLLSDMRFTTMFRSEAAVLASVDD